MLGSAPVSLGAEWAGELAVPGFVVADLRFPPGLVLEPHAHDRTTIAVILQGGFDGRWGRHEGACAPGTLVVEPAGEQHANHFWGPQPTRVAIVQPVAAELDLQPMRGHRATMRPDAVPLAGRLVEELQHPDSVTPIAVEGLSLELAAIAARRGWQRVARQPWLRHAGAIVEERHAESLTLAELADEVGVHPTHLARAFRAAHGRSVGTFLREVRVRRAAERLSRTDEPIADIALGVGFADQSHMTRWFVRYVGVSPARYRAIVRT